MSNPRRICEPNLTYHVISRCIELKPLMKHNAIKDMVMAIIHKAEEKYDFNLIAFALMDTHFHFIIQTIEGGATISRIMQYIKARIAEKYNKIMKRTGPFWNERFKDIIVEKQENPVRYLLYLLWYLAFNPVRAGKCCDPRSYKYSSINHYLKEEIQSSLKIIRHRYFEELGVTFAERVNKFLYYEDYYRKRMAFFV